MEQFPLLGSEFGGGVPIPASSHSIFLYDGFTASSNTPEWEHRHRTLFQYVEIVPCASAARHAAVGTFLEQLSALGSELGFGAPLPASSHIIFLYEGLTTSFNTPEGEHRTPTLFQCVELVPLTSEPRRAGFPTREKGFSR